MRRLAAPALVMLVVASCSEHFPRELDELALPAPASDALAPEGAAGEPAAISMLAEVAREALVYQNMTVTEAADLVGYTNPANFATAFRKHFGSVPSLHRSQTFS